MISIPEVVKQIVKQSPFLEEGLAQGIINYSALARKIKSQVEEILYKEVENGAIVMALNRLSKKIKHNNQNQLNQVLKQLTDITVRSNIVEFTYANSPTLIRKQVILVNNVRKDSNSFLTITDGIFETSIFASSGFEKQIEKIFEGEHLKSKVSGLSSITIILPELASHVAGVYYTILKQLAWDGVNLIEVVSSFTELTFFLEEKYINQAFGVLKKLY